MFIAQQLDRLLDLGLEELTGRDEEELVEIVGEFLREFVNVAGG